MRIRCIVYLSFLTVAAAVICTKSDAQVLDLGKTDPSGGVKVKKNPPPGQSRITTKDAFRMDITELNTTKGGPFFLLQISKSKAIGPFRYKTDSKIGKKENPYSIVGIKDGSFSLKSWKEEKIFGPFKFVDGEVIKTDSSTFVLVKKHAFIIGTLNHPTLTAKNNSIYLLRASRKLHDGVAKLRAQFITLEYTHEEFKAPRELIAPKVITPNGTIRPPYINRSERDISNNRRSTDLQARKSFQTFCKNNFIKVATANRKGSYAFKRIPPGRYMICCEGLRKNDDGDKHTRTRPTFWWTYITLEPGDAIRLNLNDDNDMNWDELFMKQKSK